MRNQVLVLASELGTAGTINGIAYDISYFAVAADFQHFKMTLCHTGLDELTETFADNYQGNSTESVATADPLTIPGALGWFEIPNFQPFEYNGVDNLIVEVSWYDSDGKAFDCYRSIVYTDRFLSETDAGATMGDLDIIMLHLRFDIEPTSGIESASLGTIKAVYQ